LWEAPIPAYKEEVLEEQGDNLLIRDRQGIIKKTRKDGTSMPQFIKFPVETQKDWEEVKLCYDGSDPKRYPDNWEELVKEYNSRDYCLYACATGFLGQPRHFMGEENLCVSYYTQPELVHSINEHWLNFNIQIWTKALSDVEFDYCLIWEDMAYNKGPLISPQMFDIFMKPYYVKLVNFLKSNGIRHIIVDSDGDMRKIIPNFINVGITAMYPWECTNGQDIRDIRKKYGKKLGIIGGLDKKALSSGKEAIKQEVQAKVPLMMKLGGYIPSLDHSVPPDVPYRNYLYYWELIREMFG
jgi:uroporphyrinogen decarboxylase